MIRQGFMVVTIDNNAGISGQGDCGVAIGTNSAYTSQGISAVAVGRFAGGLNQ